MEPRGAHITLAFNGLMNLDDLKNRVLVEENGAALPPVDVLENPTDLTYQRDTLEPSASYKVTILPTVRNVFGQALGGEPIVITFTTRAAP